MKHGPTRGWATPKNLRKGQFGTSPTKLTHFLVRTYHVVLGVVAVVVVILCYPASLVVSPPIDWLQRAWPPPPNVSTFDLTSRWCLEHFLGGIQSSKLPTHLRLFWTPQIDYCNRVEYRECLFFGQDNSSSLVIPSEKIWDTCNLDALNDLRNLSKHHHGVHHMLLFLHPKSWLPSPNQTTFKAIKCSIKLNLTI